MKVDDEGIWLRGDACRRADGIIGRFGCGRGRAQSSSHATGLAVPLQLFCLVTFAERRVGCSDAGSILGAAGTPCRTFQPVMRIPKVGVESVNWDDAAEF